MVKAYVVNELKISFKRNLKLSCALNKVIDLRFYDLDCLPIQKSEKIFSYLKEKETL